MTFRERVMYHQIHPLKLATDIAVTPIALYLLWIHRVWAAIGVAFIPPVIVSTLMLAWPPNLERIRDSAAGQYLRQYMTPLAQLIRFLTLAPMAYGAWTHSVWPICLGVVVLVATWSNGLLFPRKATSS
jgi:hypothetical protein